jgi:hypothetical protein
MTAMREIKFNLKPVSEKPHKRYRKGSKFDPIIDAFASGSDSLVAVAVPKKDARAMRS